MGVSDGPRGRSNRSPRACLLRDGQGQMADVTRLMLDPERGLDRRRLHLTEITDDAEAPLETVAADLRAARLRLGEDLASVSHALRIRKDHLEAIENGDYAVLPGKTYAIGFVRAYAEHLGLDADACVRRFKEENAGRADANEFSFPEIAEETKLSQGSMIILAALLAIGIYGGWYLSVSADLVTNRVPAVPERLDGELAAPPAVAPPPAEPEAAAPAAPDFFAMNPDQPAAGEGAAPPSDEAEIASLETGDVVGEKLPQGQVFGAQNVDSRITVLAKVDTWLRIEDQTGKVFINREIKAGDAYRVPDRQGVILIARDAGSLELLVDGKSIGDAGPSGTVLTGMPLTAKFLLNRNRAGTE